MASVREGGTLAMRLEATQWRIQGKSPLGSPLFIDQIEERRAEKKFFDSPFLLSQGLDPPVQYGPVGQFLYIPLP